jgi:hypothetical protein
VLLIGTFCPSSRIKLKRKLMAFLVSIMLSGCADFSALRNCDKSGEAYYGAIPIASRSEHEQSQRFTPTNPGNCLVYVVREKDWWTGASVNRATVMLTPAEHKPPLLPSELYTHYRDQVLVVDREVYAMWELPPGAYLLTAVFNRSFGGERDYAKALKFLELSIFGTFKWTIPQVELNCRPGGLLFFAVGDRGYTNNIMLKELSEEDVRTYVHKGVRSVGLPDFNEKIKVWYKDCPVDKQRR